MHSSAPTGPTPLNEPTKSTVSFGANVPFKEKKKTQSSQEVNFGTCFNVNSDESFETFPRTPCNLLSRH